MTYARGRPAGVLLRTSWARGALGGGGPFRRGAYLVWVVGCVVLLGFPLTLLFVQSFRADDGSFTVANYTSLLADASLIEATLNSLWVGSGTVAGCLLVGLPMAYLVARTDLPFKRLLRTSTVLTFSAPSFIAAMGWILLLGPRSGLINDALVAAFGLEAAPFDIFSPWGIIFVLTMFLYPLVFLPVAAAFDNLDPDLEQAAASLGGRRWTVLRRITLPLLLPSVFSGGMLVFVIAFVIFGPVAILGAPVGFDTIPTAMLKLMSFPPRIETAAVLSVPVLAVIALILLLQRKVLGHRRFSVVGGKPGRRSPARLGAWRAPATAFCLGVLFVSLVLPFGMLVVVSFKQAMGLPLAWDNLVLAENYLRVLAQDRVVDAFRNSFVLAVLAVAFGIAFSLLAAWLVQRNRLRAGGAIAPVMTSPLAFPGAVLGIALIIAYAGDPASLGGTLLILFIGYAVIVLPLSFAYVNAAMLQIGPEVEEASRSLGASWPTTWRRITLPLMRHSVLAVALLQFVLIFRELDTSIFLYTGANPTTSTVLYNLASEALFQRMGAMSVLVLAVNITVVLIAARWVRHDTL